MENQNEDQKIIPQENKIQDLSKNEIPNNNIISNIKEINIKLSTNNIQINKIQKNELNNINEEMAVNKMDIEKEQGQEENNSEEQKKQLNENIQEENENKKERNSLIRFPLAKIKNIMKLDNDIKLCQKDAYTVIGKVTEMFLQELAQSAYAVCKSCKRKTINLEDISSAIKMDPKMGFINFNSIFYVQELNKVKKRPTSTKKIEKKNIEEEKVEVDEKNTNLENNENNEIKSKGKKKRGKTNTKDKDKNKKTFNNMTLDSMFGLKNN